MDALPEHERQQIEEWMFSEG